MTPDARRVRIVLAYDGTAYAGWQIQPDLPTVQGVVRDALTRIQGGGTVKVRGAGRTDAGVHATAQVADAEVRSRLDDDDLRHALRRILPDDVRPRAIRTVAPSFHSQYLARSKTYVYRIDRDRDGDPFLARFTAHVPHELDLEAMNDALSRLPGTRDWSGFAGAACDKDDRIRTLTEATMSEPAPGVLSLRFSANGFLTHMVRNLVGTLLEVGTGRFEPARVDTVLERRDRTLGGAVAPARGLCLSRVRYDGFDDPEPGPWPFGGG